MNPEKILWKSPNFGWNQRSSWRILQAELAEVVGRKILQPFLDLLHRSWEGPVFSELDG